MVSSQHKTSDVTIPRPPVAQGVPPQVKILQMMNAYRLAQSISVAAKLGIADLLTQPQSVTALAQTTATHEQSLYRLLRVLASFDIFTEDENGLFHLTPRGALLQTNISNSLRDYAIVVGEMWHWRMWGGILHSIKTGEPAFDQIFGMEFQEYYQQNPEVAKNFDGAMVSALAMTDVAILANYDFTSFQRIVDIGAGGQGDGKLIASILKNNSSQQGVYFDTPTRIEQVERLIEVTGLSDRTQLVTGDVFQSFPPDGDVYIIKNLIHDYDDDRAIAILKNCRQAIATHGKLLLIEMVIPPGNEPSLGKILDVEALLMSAGAIERTQEQYQQLLAAAGFQLTNIISSRSPMSIIESVPT
ncbi:O-demethylpuromycin O-methyltransferase [Gloeocapsa sp. PCC 7428]|uniref:methyltransferase n=1 Tax=Gloeocapsa sp. PCC 7428 TaxID=1173026 RepID=UPI0002A60B84|nr:methyltransferase [Gloeocapsa sp. PCC 7428]AFZ33266.1 O-demethylpuromycin O-methyltransferase [Gloeocapsa sp. PCC 7428]